MKSAVKQPGKSAAHAEPAESAHQRGDLRIVIEEAEACEKIIPIVDDVAAIADGEERKLLRASVGHIGGDGEELFEEEKCAERRAGNVAFRSEIDGESKRRKKLQERAARDGNPLAEKAEEQVAAFVNGNEDDVNHKQGAAVAIGLGQKQQIKNQPDSERPARDGLPFFLEGFEERKARGESVRKIHGGAGRVRGGGGRAN